MSDKSVAIQVRGLAEVATGFRHIERALPDQAFAFMAIDHGQQRFQFRHRTGIHLLENNVLFQLRAKAHAFGMGRD